MVDARRPLMKVGGRRGILLNGAERPVIGGCGRQLVQPNSAQKYGDDLNLFDRRKVQRAVVITAGTRCRNVCGRDVVRAGAITAC